MAVHRAVTSPGERYGELRRIENRFNGEVNQYFLCDKGRFGGGYVNREDRPRQPQFRSGTSVTTVSVDQALDQVISTLQGKKYWVWVLRALALNQTLHYVSWLVRITSRLVSRKRTKLG